jgi:hypothetical protein
MALETTSKIRCTSILHIKGIKGTIINTNLSLRKQFIMEVIIFIRMRLTITTSVCIPLRMPLFTNQCSSQTTEVSEEVPAQASKSEVAMVEAAEEETTPTTTRNSDEIRDNHLY